MGRLGAAVVLAAVLGPGAVSTARESERPAWAQKRQMTVVVDSVLLGGIRALDAAMPSWRVRARGSPALMLRVAERELRAQGRPVAPVVVIGLGYNSLWERGRRRYGYWSARFDREALALLRTLRRLGARQLVWVTLREGRQPARYSWYFPYVNERLRRLDRRRGDLVLADWRRASRTRRRVTYDGIHLTPNGAALMARTIRRALFREANRQARAQSSPPRMDP